METTVTKKNEEMREITSVVLVPGVADWHDEIYDEKEVLKAERNFSKYCKKANLQHEIQLDESQAEFVESYIIPNDMIHDGRVVKKGSWLATMKVKSDALWEAVKQGTFKGFSIGCKTRVEHIVAKARGNYEGDLGRTATKRLSEFNFKEEFCHVALVTEGANGSNILVMKAKDQEQQAPNEPNSSKEPVTKTKDDNMSDITKEEYDAIKAREAELLQEVEAMKAKAEADKVLAEEVEAMKQKEVDMQAEIDAFIAKEEEALKAKEEAEKADLVLKAKSLDAICSKEDHEKFGADMYLFKSLAPESFERIIKHLETADANLKNSEYVFKEVGSSEQGQEDLEGEELIEFKAKKLMEEDSSLKIYTAKDRVRKEMRQSATK